MLIASMLLLLLSVVTDQQIELNPVYAQLLQTGVEINETLVKFPQPTMVDGLDAEQQNQIISEIGGEAYDFKSMIRPSTVAPHVMRTELKEEGKARYRVADFWFVTYGKLDVLTDETVLQQMLDPNKEEGEGNAITTEVLKSVGIEISDAEHDAYGRVSYLLEKKVDLHLTGRAYWSKTDESIVATMIIDPRFSEHAEFASTWSPMTRDVSGQLQPGAAQPYRGMGLYMKVTQLKGVEGALFVECHLIFNEPVEWFDGLNYLGSKLPPIVSKQVRTMRAELSKASQ
jgi:hypothetical protein